MYLEHIQRWYGFQLMKNYFFVYQFLLAKVILVQWFNIKFIIIYTS